LGQKRGLKNPWAGEKDVFMVHPKNGLNGLILNWCTGGYWFIPTVNIFAGTCRLYAKETRKEKWRTLKTFFKNYLSIYLFINNEFLFVAKMMIIPMKIQPNLVINKKENKNI